MDLSGFLEKSYIEVNHLKEILESKFIQRQRKILIGGGTLGKRMEAGTGVAMAKELSLWDSKFTFAWPIVRPWAQHSSRMFWRC